MVLSYLIVLLSFFQRTIFGTILKFWLDRVPDLSQYFTEILSSTLDVYSTILQELLPTPAKTHYTFNLRDLSKVFQGMLMYEPDHLKVYRQTNVTLKHFFY